MSIKTKLDYPSFTSSAGQSGKYITTQRWDYKSSYVVSRTRTGYSNPKWKADIIAGRNAATSFNASEQVLVFKPSSMSISIEQRLRNPSGKMEWTPYTCWSDGAVNYVGVSPLTTHLVKPGVLQKSQDQATRKLYGKIRQLHSQFEGGVFAGEIRQTIRMLARPAAGLRKGILQYSNYVRNLKHGKKLPKGVLQKMVADTYLEYVFGWMPLMADIRDATKAYKRLLDDVDPERFRVKGYETSETTSGSSTLNVPPGTWFLSRTLNQIMYETVYYGAFKPSAIDRRKDPSIARVMELSGFDLKSFIPTLWELTPWSFAIDYFVNIGSLLAAATTDTSGVSWLNRVDKAETVRVNFVDPDFARVSAYYGTDPANSRLMHQTGSSGHFGSYFRTVVRVPNVSVPVMKLRFSAPDLWSKQTLNLAALFLGARFWGAK
jgi:hypothetical protein